MAEIITGITAVTDVDQPTIGTGGGLANMLNALLGRGGYDGYAVETSEQTIAVLIDNAQSCCESWGYLASDDDLTAFIGAELREVAVVDEGLNTRMVEAGADLDEGGIVFVNFVTDRGVFQIACYNGHNGYYGHEVHIVCRQFQRAIGV